MNGNSPPSQRELPDGWCWATFSTVVTIAANLVPPQEWPELPHVAPDNVARDTGLLLPYRTIAEDGVTSAKHLFEPGQLIYSKIRPYLNKCVRVDFRGLCSADMYPLDVHIEAAYMHSYILSRQFVSAVSEASGSRTVLPKTNQQQLSEIPIPVPPVEEQRRIATAIDSYCTRLDDATTTLARVERNLKRYRASVLKAAVEGRLVPTEATLAKQERRTYEPASVLLERILAERRRRWSESGRKSKYQDPECSPDAATLPELPQGWCWATMDKLLVWIEAGKNFRCEERPPLSGEVGVVKVSAVTWGRFQEDESKTCTRAELANDDLLVRPGDFLFSRANTVELVGACVIVDTVTRRVMLSDKILRLHTVGGLERWLMWVLRSGFGRRQIEDLATGNQDSMRNIGQRAIQIEDILGDLEARAARG